MNSNRINNKMNNMNNNNKIILVRDLKELKEVLVNEKKIIKSWLSTSICSEKIAITNKVINRNINMLRIWRTNTIFDYHYNSFSSSNYIGCLDYIKKWDCIKIDYMNINDPYYANLNSDSNILNEEEIKEVINIFIQYVKIIARKEGKKKIVVDVHKGLKIYKRYYEREGFIVTNYRCYDNPNWFEAELIL